MASVHPCMCEHADACAWIQMPYSTSRGAAPLMQLPASKQVTHPPHLTSSFFQPNELVLSWCQRFARPVKETFLVVGCWARSSVVNHNLSRPESLMVPSAWYSSVCLHALHTQCFMQCSVYNDASLVLGCMCVLYPCGNHFVHFFSLRSLWLFFMPSRG